MTLNKPAVMRIGILLPIFVLIFLCDTKAQLLGNWPFNGSTAGSPGLYNTVSNASFSSTSTSTGYSGSVYYGENGWPAGALSTAAYFQFSLQSTSGNALNILSVVLSMRRSSTGSPSGSGPNSWAIRSSVDNYTANLSTGSLTHNISNVTVTMPMGFGLLTSNVTFRVYGYNASTTSGGLNRLVFDNIQVTGSNIVLADNKTIISAKNKNQNINITAKINDISPANIYTIERSADMINFAPIHTINAGAIKHNQYNFIDNNLNNTGKWYYRISILSANNNIQYSNITMVSFSQQQLKLFMQGDNIILRSDISGTCNFLLFSSSGACVYNKQFSSAGQQNTIAVPNLKPGIYYACLQNDKFKRTAIVKKP